MKNVLQYDLGGSSIFFDGDFTSDHDKHLLVHELENYFQGYDNCNKQGLHNKSLVADFMANLTKVNVLGCCNFERACSSKYGMLFNSCNFERIDVVYDNYIKNSIKYSERQDEKPLILYCFTIYRQPQSFLLKWISFGPVTKTMKIYN